METTTTNIDSSSSQSRNTLDDEHLTEKCPSSVFVVTSALVGLIMGIGIGVMFMIFKQVIQRKKRQDQTTAEANVSSEIQGETINAYDEIDDTIFVSHDANIDQDEENSDTSTDSSNTEQRRENTQNTDYLNPYQPIIPTTDPHMYMTPVTNTECSNTDPEASDIRSSSFINDDTTDEEIDDILFVSHDDNINQNEENSDTPSTPTSEKQRSHNNLNTDYLNPYQPIIPTTDPHLYMTPDTSTECSNTDQQATAEDSSLLSNDDKTEGSLKSDSGSLMFRPLHYVELEINILSEDSEEPDKYVNTSINANQPTEIKASTQKTQYAKIEKDFKTAFCCY